MISPEPLGQPKRTACLRHPANAKQTKYAKSDLTLDAATICIICKGPWHIRSLLFTFVRGESFRTGILPLTPCWATPPNTHYNNPCFLEERRREQFETKKAARCGQ